jgi:imidazolonepropionase-like amidohydrolase
METCPVTDSPSSRLRSAVTPLLGAALLIAPAAVRAEDPAIALIAAQLIDGRGAAPSSDTVVVVRDDRIVAVGGPEVVPTGARRIDLGGSTLLPGLIDAHAHPLIWSDDYQTEHLRASSAYKALRGLEQVQLCLAAGWTTMRYTGDADVYYAVIDIRRAIDEGRVSGPRLTGAAHYISITGGGGDINFGAPEQHLIADGLVVDGVDAMRKAVRNEVKYGSDWIKLMVTGAFMSAGDDPKDVHLSPEELAVAMDEARRLGVPVMAHAHSTEGIVQAIEAGVRSIEHGTFIDREGIRLARKHGTYLVPTFYLGDYYIAEMADSVAQRKMVELSRKYRDEHMRNLRAAVAAGVKVVVGTDMTCNTASIRAREFAALVEAGMTPLHAIHAGTLQNAELLGWQDRIGSLEAGKLADVIAVDGDPLAEIAALERVVFVMKDGDVIKQPETADPRYTRRAVARRSPTRTGPRRSDSFRWPGPHGPRR